MLRDDDAFPVPLRLSHSHEELTLDPPNHFDNDNLDDVFGSEPGSPTFENDEERGGNEEQSDIPRLKEKHETEGYRDGVTKGKAESVQAGFDEGYGLGAVLGLKIGKILGLLEGIYAALNSAVGEELTGEKLRIEKVSEEAKKELSTQSVFGKEWWGEDGIWKYDVAGEKEGKDVLFPDVAAAHPLLMKWERIVETEIAYWSLDMEIMDHEHAEPDDASEGYGLKHKTAEGREVAAEPIATSGTFMGIPKKDLNW